MPGYLRRSSVLAEVATLDFDADSRALVRGDVLFSDGARGDACDFGDDESIPFDGPTNAEVDRLLRLSRRNRHSARGRSRR